MALFRLSRSLFGLAFSLASTAAHACTVCNSRTAHQVRAGIFNGHFLHMLLLIAAPFPVFAAVILLLHFGMPDLDVPETRTVEHEAVLTRIRIGHSRTELSA